MEMRRCQGCDPRNWGIGFLLAPWSQWTPKLQKWQACVRRQFLKGWHFCSTRIRKRRWTYVVRVMLFSERILVKVVWCRERSQDLLGLATTPPFQNVRDISFVLNQISLLSLSKFLEKYTTPLQYQINFVSTPEICLD